jgi:methionyl-tRNA formyltransferase
MNIFAGFGKLGYVCLNEIINKGISINYVLTHKDTDSESVESLSKENNIKCFYVDLRKDSKVLNKLLNIDIKFLISVNYRFILPEELLQKSEYPLNLHGSLLPKYRGRTPHVWAIINGEKETGITCHLMEKTVDTGDIYHQEIVPIEENDTGASLINKFITLYPKCLIESIEKISKGYKPKTQDHSKASYFGKRIPDMGYIDFTKDNDSIIDFIRAQSRPYPGAYCFLENGRKLIVHKARIMDRINDKNLPVGNIQELGNLYIAKTKNSFIEFIETEVE